MCPHIFLSAPLIIFLFIFPFHAEAMAEGRVLSLKPILDELTEERTSNTDHESRPILLHGQYQILEYIMRSVNISIVGTPSASIVSNQAEYNHDISNSEPSPMLIVLNSTVSLSSLRLICNGDNISVATISQSSLSVSKCEICAASGTSPFLSTWTSADTSILTVVGTQVIWRHASSLPLFGTMAHNHKSPVTESSEDPILGRDTDHATGILSIIGTGLSFSNTALPLATGPLFDFGFNRNDIQQSLFAASVSLTASAMTNVTSPRRFIADTLRFPLASQRLISSSISQCTNHLYGTGSLDMNLGSALCCLNSSFSKCESDPDPTEGPPTVYLQHRTTQFDHALSPDCTLFDTCTFRDIRAERGGAIDSLEAGVSLTITKCSFTRCSADVLGGSVFCRPSPSCSAVVSHCSFVSGNANHQGGGMQLTSCSQGSVTDCVFFDLSATTFAGGLMMNQCQGPFPVSNCLFQKCCQNSSTGSGGALHTSLSAFTFTSLRFRENMAITTDRGHDVSAQLNSATQVISSFVDCDTDQEVVQIYFIGASITPNLVTALNSLTVLSVSRSVSSNDKTAKATLTVDQPISGTVLMLVDNTNGYEMPNDNSPPPISRMISFDFSSDSTSTKSDLSFGEWEQLQFEANYSLVTFGWKDSIVDTKNAVLTTPNPPRIVQAICEVGNSKFDAFVSLKGRTLATGSYKASVKVKSDFWMEVDFVRSASGGNIFSTKAGLKLQGEDAILDFETTYEIDEVIQVSTGIVLILDPPRLFFTTPSSPTLKRVGPITFSNTQQDTVTIALVGEKLFANPYTLTVTDGSATSTLTAVFDADGVNGKATAVVYSMDGSKTVHLGFGTTYTIIGLTCAGINQPKFAPNLQIVVPPEPTWTAITVNEGGSNRTDDCGSAENPCGSVVWGWRTRQRKVVRDGIRIEIKEEVGFGERIQVGSERLVIQSAKGNKCRLMCDNSVIGTGEGNHRTDGIMTIGGGTVELSSLVLSLPSTSSEVVGGQFVIFGKGRCVVESVEIVADGSGRVGMGVGWVCGGEMAVNSVLMRNVVLGVTLFGGEDKHEGIDFSVSELTVENTTTSDSLLHFSSLSPSSSFSLTHSSFLTTIRAVDSVTSSSSPTNLSLISISSCHESVSVADCVFEKSGTCLSSSPSTFTGSTLHITLSSSSQSKPMFVMSSCLFVDCLSVWSGSGTVHISTGTCSARLVLSNNWFENLVSGEKWPSRKGGIAVLDWSRSASVSGSSSSSTAPVGIFVYFGSLRPTIIRRRCILCSSRLVVQKSE
ncbi:hypothetical protein BLNAU_3289 [Blattamonas nauphoetae]|uniref:Right handed beta helix domain-containing protein n=1 Tax=Blattamonas nauphoetae TaxID=2049346 RepID=A0ABQ9YDN9_9EUKA|nr:hypothetical protein BLNAU_3289 [Blattamonas nauphoetae]